MTLQFDMPQASEHSPWQETPTRIAPHGVSPLPLAERLGRAENVDKGLTLTARRFRVADAAELRLVEIEGPRIEIFMALGLPDYPGSHPMFAAEIVASRGQLRAAFIDLQTPGLADEPRRRTAQIAGELRRRRRAEEDLEPAPDWATTYSTGGYVFLRSNTMTTLGHHKLREARSAYWDYLQAWGAALSEPILTASSEEAEQEVRRCHALHRANSPGAPWLASIFGREWSNAFCDEFLYH